MWYIDCLLSPEHSLWVFTRVYQITMRRRSRRRTGPNKYVFLAGFGILLALLVYLFLFQGTLPSLSPAAYFPSPTPTSVPRNPLKKIVDNNLKGAQGTYAVVVKNMKNGQSFSYNQNRPYDTASLYKAWILASIYEKIEKGDLKEDTLLEADIAELNKEFNIPPELAEQTAGKTLYTVHDALQKMIAISDNYASLLLTHEVTYDGIDFFLLHYGMNNSHTGEGDETPSTTAADEARFYELLYTGKLANKENTKKMIELLKQNEFKTVIPKYIPVQVAHKTGVLDHVSHDAGIVFTKKGDYIIVLMSESGVPPAAEERMARISEDIYQYFMTLPDPSLPPNQLLTNIIKFVFYIFLAGLTILFMLLIIKKRKNNKEKIFI